jgi:hypothetical protein
MRAMRRPAMCARLLAVVIAALAVVSLGAQQRAPGLESIRQEDLRADLFFLAGDAMRGRLTDTVENVATGDYIRARFERAGLKPAAGGSYFQNYYLMTATLGEGNGLEVAGASGVTQRFAHGQEFIRSASARPARRPARWCSPASASRHPRWATTTMPVTSAARSCW